MLRNRGFQFISGAIISVTILWCVPNASARSRSRSVQDRKDEVAVQSDIKDIRRTIGTLSLAERESRLAHARELLGKYYKHSIVRTGEQVKKINNMIYRWTYQQLPRRYKRSYKRIAQTIIDQSYKYDFDPVFLLAVITNESSFIPTRVGKFGEIGLMQIKPKTGRWLARMVRMRWHGKRTLRNPVLNIKLGAAYLSFLREKFDSQARLYLAAYNMGQGNVKDALARDVWPKDYPFHVMRHYIKYYAQLRDE